MPRNQPDDLIDEDSRQSAVDKAVGGIRELIRSRALKVGDALPTEMELVSMLGAGRNTVREAVRILKAFGIVESRQKAGMTITDRRWHAAMDLYSFGLAISEETFIDVQNYRRLVEINIADTVFEHMDGAHIAELKQLNDQMRLSDVTDAVDFDFRFHEAIISSSQNRTLVDIYGIMRPIIVRLMRLGKEVREAREQSYAEHLGIIGAIEERDRIAYAHYMSLNLKAGLPFARAVRD
jgi:GntR family transcriptional repressor for pyruvate dehydrogenase complex